MYMKSKKDKSLRLLLIAYVLLTIFVLTSLTGCTDKIEKKYDEVKDNIQNSIQNNIEEQVSSNPFEFVENSYSEGESYINSADDINLKDTNGKSKNYSFVYNNETYLATYTKDNWHIKDSYKIRNKHDIKIICEALNNVHKVHGKDMKSYRTADDMMTEWVQHNIAYDYLPEDSSLKSHAKDVDLDPADQGKSLKEMYETRIKNSNK